MEEKETVPEKSVEELKSNQKEKSKKDNLAWIILFVVAMVFLAVIGYLFIVQYSTNGNVTSPMSTSQASPSATETGEVGELENLSDELETTVTDLEKAVEEIEDYQGEEDTMPAL